jgi:hypothetical protein
VTKIDALVIKQKVTSDEVGHLKEATTEPIAMEVPNLGVTLAESHAGQAGDGHAGDPARQVRDVRREDRFLVRQRRLELILRAGTRA